MRLGRGIIVEKPTLRFTSAGGLNPYAARLSLILEGPQSLARDRIPETRTSCGSKASKPVLLNN